MRRKIVLFLLAISVLAPAKYGHTTADFEDPDEIMEMLRLFLSNPKIANDVQLHAQAGCTWVSERIWSGGGEEVSEGVFRYGGEFTITFKTTIGKEKHLQFDYQTELSAEGSRLFDVSGGVIDGSSVNC